MEKELWFVESHSNIQWISIFQDPGLCVFFLPFFFFFLVFKVFKCWLWKFWRCGWLVASVCLSALFIVLNFQCTVWILLFLVSLLEKAWNLISVILSLWCPLSSLSCNFSIIQFRAVAIVLFLMREVLFFFSGQDPCQNCFLSNYLCMLNLDIHKN